MGRFLYQVLAIVLVGMNFSVNEAKRSRSRSRSRWGGTSWRYGSSDRHCKEICDKDCQQYLLESEISSCVEAKEKCTCGLATKSSLAVFGVLLFLMGLHSIMRYCDRILLDISQRPIVARPMQPNVGVGSMQPNIDVSSKFSQPGSTFYPSAPAPPGAPVSTQVLYNPGSTNSNFIRGSKGPPSYSEVVLENTDTNKEIPFNYVPT